jgi:hypothetical protein
MNTDPEQFFEDLAKSYPELMEKSSIGDYIGIEPGWFNIIDVLCNNIYDPFYTAKGRLKAATDYPRDDGGSYLKKCETNFAKELDDLPHIVQIKEKFGNLRFYTKSTTERVGTLIRFAETMSGCTCEVCGKPGSRDVSHGNYKTLCIDHSRTPIDETLDGKIHPIFQEDDV